MENVRGVARGLTGECAHAGNSEAQDLDRTVPGHHDLRRLQAIVHDMVRVRVIQSLTGLTGNILQVPDGKPFVAGQHGADAVALHVLHRGAELPVNFFHTVKQCDVVAVERLAALGFLQNVLDQQGSLLRHHLQPDGLQSNRLPALRICRLIDSADFRMRDLAEDLETSDTVGHCSLSPRASRTRQSREKTPGVVRWGKGTTRIARLNNRWELRRYSPKWMEHRLEDQDLWRFKSSRAS